jgi:phosphotransferase system enzyme I (PtsP)
MDRLALVEDISRLASNPDDDVRATLDALVSTIANGMETEVCSLYLLDPTSQRLVLRATVGLDRASVGIVSMRTNEGLVGLVLEKMQPVAVADAISHPRYKYFPETGEERFHSFLGVPVLGAQRKPIGVLVVQTLRARDFHADEVRLLRTACNQVAQILSHFNLREALITKEKERDEYRRRMIEANRELKNFEKVGGKTRRVVPPKIRRPRLVGLAASPGFGQGCAHVVGGSHDNVDRALRTATPMAELKRLEDAVAHARAELDRLKSLMAPLIPRAELRIFDSHRLLLEDEEFIGSIRDQIRGGYAAESAVMRVIDKLALELGAIRDGYLRERSTDLRDLGARLVRHLGQDESVGTFKRPTVLVAEDLTLSELALISHTNLAAIVLQSGGVTSHATILARAFEIPAVVGVDRVTEAVATGDDLIVDGNSGIVYLRPSAEVEREYTRIVKRYQTLRQELLAEHGSPAVTKDGHGVGLLANIALKGDAALALRYGAEGIGLYRSEFTFLTYDDFPDEQQQLNAYLEIMEASGGKPVTIRTLDLGADKYPAYLRAPREENPFLGWRSIRISLEMPELFKVQLRAILRAAANYPVHVLFPMISSVEELRGARALLAEAAQSLSREGIEHNPNVKVGIMVEVPSALWLAARLVSEVDFFSIGTNDLIQFMLAVDRNNAKVAPLFEPFHPAVLAGLNDVVTVAHAQGKTVSLCGEMAGDPMATLLLIGMGLDQLSLSPVFIPVVRKLVREATYEAARGIARDVLQMATVKEIKGYLVERYRELGLIGLVEIYR